MTFLADCILVSSSIKEGDTFNADVIAENTQLDDVWAITVELRVGEGTTQQEYAEILPQQRMTVPFDNVGPINQPGSYTPEAVVVEEEFFRFF